MINLTQEQIMKNWGVNNSNTPIVSVRCLTYNHENYIAQALDGFLMQKTNFPFEVIVHDDASTDKTADIIREYESRFPKIIKPIYQKENQWAKHDGTIARIMNETCIGKYVAFCEGDDYWIDENKLQMQVDFLEHNLDCGMCYTQTKKYFQNKRKFGFSKFGEHIKDFDDLLFNGNRIPTLSVCVRKDLVLQYYSEIKPIKKKWRMGDYPLWLYVSYFSSIKFQEKITGVYRVLEESASHTNDIKRQLDFKKSYYEIRNYFSEKYRNQKIDYDENEFLFDIYYKQCLTAFSLDYRNNMIYYYSHINNPNKRIKILYFLCKNIFIFRLFILFNKIRLYL